MLKLYVGARSRFSEWHRATGAGASRMIQHISDSAQQIVFDLQDLAQTDIHKDERFSLITDVDDYTGLCAD